MLNSKVPRFRHANTLDPDFSGPELLELGIVFEYLTHLLAQLPTVHICHLGGLLLFRILLYCFFGHKFDGSVLRNFSDAFELVLHLINAVC